MPFSKLIKYTVCSFVLQCTMQPAFADAGVPTIIAIWPMAWILLIVIIPLEAKVAQKIFKIPFRKCLEISAHANYVSTLAGVPITWFLLAIIEFGLGGGIRIINHHMTQGDWIYHALIEGPILVTGSAPKWVIPVSLFMMNFPFCIMSIFVEQKASEKFIDEVCTKLLLRKWAWFANIASYTFLNLLAAIIVAITFFIGAHQNR